METKIIFEDENLLVLDKPAGMTVNKSDTTMKEATLQDWVEEYLKIPNPKPQISNKLQIKNNNYEEQSKMDFVNRAGIVHRLDKETSGIILVAKTLGVFINLQAQFKERKVQKTYLALVYGAPKNSRGIIDSPVARIGAKTTTRIHGTRDLVERSAVTEYRTVQSFDGYTLLECMPKTGRTHQIRIHAKHIGHSIVADEFYAGRKTARNDRIWCPRLFLHASGVKFIHPVTAKVVEFKSELSQDLITALHTLQPSLNPALH